MHYIHFLFYFILNVDHFQLTQIILTNNGLLVLIKYKILKVGLNVWKYISLTWIEFTLYNFNYQITWIWVCIIPTVLVFLNCEI